MKKVLSALLALIMVVSCMAGITFTTAAEETETLLYVTGTGTGGPSCSRDGAITYGQTFTVAKGKMVTTVKVTLSDPAVTHTFRLYRWDNNRTYEENKAVAPLVEKSFTVKSNAENVFDLTDSVNPGYTGSLYWEIERTDTGRGSSPYGSKGVMTENGDITNIASYVNGQKGTGFSGAAVAHNAKVIVVDAPATETTVDLYGGGDYSNMCWSSNGTTVSFGQILTVAEGKAATALQVMLGGTKGGSMKLSVYRYVSENILASIASTPLYTENFVAVIDSYMTFTFDEALTGPLYWEITAADGISGLAATPKGGNSALTETADGSVTGINHVQNRTIGAAFVDWSAAKSIRAKLVLDSEATATNTPAPLTEEVKLYNGNLAGNIAIGSNWTISSFAQKFTVPSNRKVAVWSQQLATANNGAGNLSFYKWNKDYATTVAAAPLYSVDITCPNNVYLSVKIPETVKMSGDLLWVVTPAASGNIMPYGATELGTGCTDFVNGTATTASGGSYGLSGWGAGANAFSAKIVLNEYHYAPTGEATVAS